MEKSEPNSNSRINAAKFWKLWLQNYQQHEANDTIPEEWEKLGYEKHLTCGFCDSPGLVTEDSKVGVKRKKRTTEDRAPTEVTKNFKSPTSATVDDFLATKVS